MPKFNLKVKINTRTVSFNGKAVVEAESADAAVTKLQGVIEEANISEAKTRAAKADEEDAE
jgi:hypothetical protein